MAATNETPILKLPQFIGTDRPSWLGDWNSAMLKIDTSVGENGAKITQVESVANAAAAKAESVGASVSTLQTDVANVEEQQNSTAQIVSKHTGQISSLETDMSGVKGQVSTLQSTVNNLQPSDVGFKTTDDQQCIITTVNDDLKAIGYNGVIRIPSAIYATATINKTNVNLYRINTITGNFSSFNAGTSIVAWGFNCSIYFPGSGAFRDAYLIFRYDPSIGYTEIFTTDSGITTSDTNALLFCNAKQSDRYNVTAYVKK